MSTGELAAVSKRHVDAPPAPGSMVDPARAAHRLRYRFPRHSAERSRIPSPFAFAPTSVVAGAPARLRNAWVLPFRRRLVVVDVLAASLASAAAFLLRFGDAADELDTTGYMLLSASVPLLWIAAVAMNHGYDAHVLGAGPEEFQRVFRAFAYLTATVAIVSYATKADLARGFVLIAFPATMLLDLVGRYLSRKRLHRARTHGVALSKVLVVGSPDRAADLAKAMMRDAYAGYRVVGACLPSDDIDEAALSTLARLGIPVVGALDDIVDAVARLDADTVAVTASQELKPDKLRWISWQLEGTGTSLVVSPGLIEVAGTRLHVRPVAGFPLLNVEAPNFSGFQRVVKGAFDRCVAAVVLIMLLPLLVVIAALVRTTSRGPALFRQSRVGRDGTTFTMIKFRSMAVDAEARRHDLLEVNEASDGLLFKLRHDPRVTRLGAILRRYSLDELPQLLNVLTGSMSLVGPRPPLPEEVAGYGDDVRRRLLVKPGLTGLWQVSGRSDLSWEESVRLDLRYVENWSMATDLMILWKTAHAVSHGSGAY